MTTKDALADARRDWYAALDAAIAVRAAARAEPEAAYDAAVYEARMAYDYYVDAPAGDELADAHYAEALNEAHSVFYAAVAPASAAYDAACNAANAAYDAARLAAEKE